jgi:two-component sensor histidine kinase
VNFGEYVQSLTDQIFRTYRLPSRQVSLRTEIDPLLLSIETAIPCGLILNELVTNSLKHAFPGDKPGDVRLRLRRRADGRCVLSVADNGVGNPQDLDVQTTRSLGLRLVRALSRQLDGTMQIERTNPGTDAQLTFFIKNGHKRLMP